MSWRKSKFLVLFPRFPGYRRRRCSHPMPETKADTPSLSDSGLHSAAPTPPPTTPEPQELPEDELVSGRLTIQISAARGLSLPQGICLPEPVQKMLDSQAATLAASVTPTTVSQQRAKSGHKSRDSVQRQQSWWLPYCILEFDVNEVPSIHCLLFQPFRPIADVPPPSRAGSYRPTWGKPRRTRLDVLGKFVRLSPYPASTAPAPVPVPVPALPPVPSPASATGLRLSPRLAEGSGAPFVSFYATRNQSMACDFL
jgi:hypothetical protein